MLRNTTPEPFWNMDPRIRREVLVRRLQLRAFELGNLIEVLDCETLDVELGIVVHTAADILAVDMKADAEVAAMLAQSLRMNAGIDR